MSQQKEQNTNPVHEVATKQNKCQKQCQLRLIVEQIHDLYFKQIDFIEVDYIVGEAPYFENLQMIQNEEKLPFKHIIIKADNCFAFTQKGYDLLYSYLAATLANNQQSWSFKDKAADLLVVMNGQHEKVYNFKKKQLKLISIQIKLLTSQKISEQYLKLINQKQQFITKQLKLNSAVVMKFKKSSSCYEYRMKLIQSYLQILKIKHGQIEEHVETLHKEEHQLILRVLNRFPRNYFCWMYRLRFIKCICLIADKYAIISGQVKMIGELLQRYPNDYSILSFFRFLLRSTQGSQYGIQIDRVSFQKCLQIVNFCKIAYQAQTQYSNLTNFISQLKERIGRHQTKENKSKQVQNK